MYFKAGLKNESLVFLFMDSQIADEKFLVYLNELLSSGFSFSPYLPPSLPPSLPPFPINKTLYPEPYTPTTQEPNNPTTQQPNNPATQIINP